MPQLQVQPQVQAEAEAQGAVRPRHRAYMHQEASEDAEVEESGAEMEPSTSLPAGRTRFVTSLPVLSSEDPAHTSLFRAFGELRARIRSAAWKPSLLVLLGHDPAKRRDEVDRQIREDEAGEAIDGELRVFFDRVLAPVIQERETALVNAMHDCFRQELQLQLANMASQEQRVAQLSQQNEQWEKEIEHLKAKVDRRVAENNALRKEQYKQLLILREIMNKQSGEPRALTALNDAIATVMTGNQQTAAQGNADSSDDDSQHKAPGRGWMTLNTGTQAWRREKEKWELRAREASVECQELREKIACLEQQLATNCANKTAQWFLKAESTVAERQRIADAVCASQCSWEDVGDSLVELLNSDILWAAMEQSARRGDKNCLSRGLEAVLVKLDSWTPPTIIGEVEANEEDEEVVSPSEVYGRRRSTVVESARLIPCGACNGAGYIRSDLDDDGANDSDSYLRKTLAQVLELKTQLEKATSKSMTLEGQLHLSYMQTAQIQGKLEQIECIKANGVDSCLQTDLDDEENIDFNEIMRSSYNQDASQPAPRQGRRNVQYEHLIVELKSTLADKDEGLAESRMALDAAQARVVALQRAIQKEKEAHSHELLMLKSSLAFSLKHRNNKIEERQAAVKLLLKKFSHEQQPPRKRRKAFALTQGDDATIKEDDEDDDRTGENGDDGSLDTTDPNGRDSDQRDVERAEKLVQRYTEDILRVQKEHEDQQNLLKKAEAEVAAEEDKRSRTNSISQGSLVVNMASHPRDLFKALATAQGETLKLRRASQRSSALQTDRLLTLTTHLGHMSEELCLLRKRNMSELEYWKLECEKLQNTNKALTAEQQLTQQQLQIAHARQTEMLVDSSSKLCVMCEKHQSRLMEISHQVLNQAQMKGFSRSDPETEVPARVELTAFDRKNLGCVLLDLEAICSSMSAMKQQLVRSFFASQFGCDLNVNPSRNDPTLIVDAEKMDYSRSPSGTPRKNNQSIDNSTEATTTTDSSPRKGIANVKGLKSKRQLKKSSETTMPALEGVQNQSDNGNHLLIKSPTKAHGVDQNASAATEFEGASRPVNCTSPAVHGEQTDIVEGLPPAYRRKTLVQEILDDGELVLTKHGLIVAPAHIHDPVVSFEDRISNNYADVAVDNNAADLDEGNSIQRRSPAIACEPQDLLSGSSPFDRGLNGESVALMNSNDIERDPEVIEQLHTLIKHSNVAKRGLTIANWEVLMCRIQYLRDQQRLKQMNYGGKMRVAGTQKMGLSDGVPRCSEPKFESIRSTMSKLLQLREKNLEARISAREQSLKECKRAQAHLIYSVSAILAALSRKGNITATSNDAACPDPSYSPRRSPRSNRPLYPSVQVNLSRLPPTQQISTSTFPVLTPSTSSWDPTCRQQTRPASANDRDTTIREGVSTLHRRQELSYGEGYHLPNRLIKSAGRNRMMPFSLIHSPSTTLHGSTPFPGTLLNQTWDTIEGQEGRAAPSAASGQLLAPQRPVRPHSSPADPRLSSPRTQDLIAFASKVDCADGGGAKEQRPSVGQTELTHAPLLPELKTPSQEPTA